MWLLMMGFFFLNNYRYTTCFSNMNNLLCVNLIIKEKIIKELPTPVKRVQRLS